MTVVVKMYMKTVHITISFEIMRGISAKIMVFGTVLPRGRRMWNAEDTCKKVETKTKDKAEMMKKSDCAKFQTFWKMEKLALMKNVVEDKLDCRTELQKRRTNGEKIVCSAAIITCKAWF